MLKSQKNSYLLFSIATAGFFLTITLCFSSGALAGVSCSVSHDTAKTMPSYNDLEESLYIGYEVQHMSFSANDNQNPLWKVQLKNPHTGQVIKALFKPRPWGDGDGWNRTPMEYVAYKINRFLGMDYIPPVAYRRHFKLGNNYFAEGSIQIFVEGAQPFQPHLLKNKNSDLFLSDARVLDILLQNPDRHAGNFMMGQHWRNKELTPLLIDQAASLRPGTDLRLESPGVFLKGPVEKFRRQTYENLKALDKRSLNSLKEFINDQEIHQILQRRDGILKRIEQLIAQRGANKVLFDN